MNKHLITWNDWSDGEIQEVLDLAARIKQNPSNYRQTLAGKTLVMLFQKTSTRTRVSFEAGMTELGGHAIFLNWKYSNFGLTKIKYEASYLSTNSHLIMARMMRHEDLLELRDGATIPVINGCCDMHHPCQALADMMTILEDRGSLQGAKLTYIGVNNNVSNSLTALAAAFGVQLTLVCPIGPAEKIDPFNRKRALEKGCLIETTDAKAAVKDADYVYTDTWVDMEFFEDPTKQAMKEERMAQMLPYQVNAELLKDSKAKVMHDMPIHPNYEISDDLVYSERSLIFKQAENRMHVQKGLMVYLLAQHAQPKP